MVLVTAAQADKEGESQMIDESKLQEKQHKREHTQTSPPPPSLPTQATLPSQQPPQQLHGPHYVMKEMILYLTPSQIKALETGQGALKLQPQSQPRPQLPYFMQKLMQQNTLQQEEKILQREIEKLEVNRKNRLQLNEAVVSAPKENINHHQHHHQHQEQPQQQQLLLQQQEQPQQQQRQEQQHLLLQQQQQQQLLLQLQQPLHQQQHKQQLQVQLPHLPNIVPHHRPELQLQNQEQRLGLVPQLQLFSQQPYQESHLNQEKQHHKPLFYILPQIKPVGNENLHLLFNSADQNDAQYQLLLHHKDYPLQHVKDHNFNLIPYEYGAENELEAKKILIANLENQLETYRLNAHQLNVEQLEASDQQLEAQRLEAVTQLTAQQYHQITPEQQEDHLVSVPAQNQAHPITPHQLNTAPHVENLHLDAHNLQEVQNLQQNHHLDEAEQLQETIKLQQAHHFEEPEQLPEALPLIESFKNNYHELNVAPQLDITHFKPNELQTLQDFQMKEVMEAQKLKKQIQAQEKEAERLDAQLKVEELKAEGLQEEQQLQFFSELKSEKNEFHSILNPLVQHHNILDILNEPVNFTPPELEKGFVPMEYTPKDNQEKYAREIEKILLENQIYKQNALTQAATIANQPPVLVKEEIIKHVRIPIPAPYIVRIPEPFEVKVPQPYPVPLEIIRHVPYPVVKVEQVEVEKPVPVEVEKRVPYTVEKKFFVKVNKPYIVKRIVPVGVKKTVPIEIPIRNKNKKISIIKHIWDN